MKTLITTCDSYAWTIPTTLKFLKRAGMPYPITVLSCTAKIDHDSVFYVGEDVDWSSNLIKYAEQTDEPFIHWCDVYIADKINHRLLEVAVRALEERPNVGMIRLCPNPIPTLYWQDPDYGMDIGQMDRTQPYSVNCSVSIWRPQAMKELLKPGESAWDFESYASQRAKDYSGEILGTYGYAVRYADYTNRNIPNPEVQKWIDSVS